MRLTRLVISVVAGMLFTAAAFADEFPSKPVRLIVGYNPGGGTDILSRTVGEEMAKELGQPIVVENRPGAEGTIASELVSKAAPDGYTLIMVSASDFTATAHFRELNFKPLEDFAPVSWLTVEPQLLLVNSTVPANSVTEFIAYAKERPGELNFATVGSGGLKFLQMADFMKRTGIEMVEVPYQGGSAMLTALLGGEVQVMFGSVSSTSSHVESGKIKALAASTQERVPFVPELPTVAEAADLPGFDATIPYGILAPAGTPPEIIEKLNAAAVAAMQTATVQKFLSDQGIVAVASTPEEFGEMLKSDSARWGELKSALGL
jgi:tripartite-type tricarboxylate transporter receptor subunit TctC